MQPYENGTLEWEESYLTEVNEILRLDKKAMSEMRRAAALVRGHAGLRGLIAECRERIIGGADTEFEAIVRDVEGALLEHLPLLESEMGRHREMFAALLVAAVLPWMAARYEERGIPQSVLVDTMEDLSIWMRHTLHERGEWGLTNLAWLMNHLRLRLFRLGRLQFCLEKFDHPSVFIRRTVDGKLAAMADAGVVYRGDGQSDGANGREDPESRWTSQFTREGGCFIGNPISSSGTALRETVGLSEAEWRQELCRGDTVLAVHIPEGSRMSLEECLDSLRQANTFYDRFFPDRPFRAFVCSSWLLDPQFQSILPPASNIVKFQRLFYLLPVLSDESETYWRVFGTRELDLRTAAGDTGLRRAILDYATSGGRMRSAVGVLLREDGLSGFSPAF